MLYTLESAANAHLAGCNDGDGRNMKLGILPFIGAMGAAAAIMTACLDMDMPRPPTEIGPKCPELYSVLMTSDTCPEGEDCQTLADGTICIKRKVVLGGGNGLNCKAGYVTLGTNLSELACEFDENKELGNKNYYCTEGAVAGRYCRKIPEDSEDSTIVPREGQFCTTQQLQPDAKSLRIHIIDIGQGDAVWIQTPTGQNILVDAGDQGLFSKTDGASIIADYLEFHGFPEGSAFDAVFVSHPDSDHYGGMKKLFASLYKINAYIDPTDPNSANDISTAYGGWVTTMKSKVPAESIYAPAEDFFEPGDAFPESFFGPEVDARYIVSSKTMASGGNRNSMSIIFKVSFAGWSTLFTGDAESVQEGRAVQLASEKGEEFLSANFLKVSHHGSDNGSSTVPFLKAVWPDSIAKEKRAAFISSGRVAYSGTYLPSPAVVGRLSYFVPDENVFSTSAGDGEKEEEDAVRDDNILIVVNPDGTQYSCYSGVN